MSNSIFLTYNPNNPIEEATALRMQTLANIYGYKISLPDRYGLVGSKIKSSTIERIENSDIVIAFCLNKLSPFLKTELIESTKKNKLVILIHDKNKDKSVKFKDYANVEEYFLDFKNNNTDEQLKEIANDLRKKFNTKKENNKELITAGIAVAGLAISLLLFYFMTDESHT